MAYATILPLFAGVAAAQLFAAPADLKLPAMKLLDPANEAYQVCNTASSFLAGCYNRFGGEAGIYTADATAVNKCACCAGTVNVAPAFSVCSSYLSAEAPLLSTQVSAYGNLYSICGANTALCASAGAGSGSSPAAKTTAPPNPFASASASGAPSPSQTQSGSQPLITTPPAATGATPIKACTGMVDYFTSCEFNTPGFGSMPFGEQASCYCCQTSNGRVFSTNGLDQVASSCAAWAITGEPKTIYPAASTFASFCEVLGKSVCDSADSTTAPARQTQANPFGGLGQTTAAPAAPSDTNHKSSAVSVYKSGMATGLIAAAVFAVMLY